jgi:hypothetical protein
MLKFHQMIILLLDTHFKHCLNIEELYHKGVDFKSLECPPVDLLNVIFEMTGIRKEKDQKHLKHEFAILFEKLVDTPVDKALPLYMEYYEKMERFFPEIRELI